MMSKKLQSEEKIRGNRYTQLARLVWYIFVWMCIWTPIAVVLGVIIIMITHAVLFGYDPNTATTTQDGLVAFILGTILLAILLFLIARQMKRYEEVFFARVGRKVLQIATSVGLVGTLSFVSLAMQPGELPEQATASQDTKISYDISHNPELLSLSQQIGAVHIDNLDMQFVDSYPQVDRAGEYQQYRDSVSEEFAYGKMTVLSGRSVNDTRRTIAHEYLHHVWFSMIDSATKDTLTSHLITMYGKDYAMQQRTDGHYSQNGTLLPTELFSFYCTESSDDYLTNYVKNMCNEYINRGVLTMIR